MNGNFGTHEAFWGIYGFQTTARIWTAARQRSRYTFGWDLYNFRGFLVATMNVVEGMASGDWGGICCIAGIIRRQGRDMWKGHEAMKWSVPQSAMSLKQIELPIQLF